MKDFSSDAEKIIDQRIDEMCGLSPEEREFTQRQRTARQGVDRHGNRQTVARKKVAQITGRSFEAVKAAHYRSERNPKP